MVPTTFHFADTHVPRLMQLMDVFLAGADPGSLNADFAGPWTDWGRFRGIEAVVQKCVDLTGQVRASMSTAGPDLSAAYTATLLDQIIQTIAELGHTATLIVQQPSSVPEPGYFNDLLRPDNEMSVSIAKSLYLTLRLHITEMLLSLVGRVDFSMDHALRSVVADELCEHVRSVVGHNSERCSGQPGMASRMFLMSWPMLAILQSSIVSHETRLWIQSLLEVGRQRAGFLSKD